MKRIHMTAAYQTFLKQFHATGSEKADGYSADAFVGLDEAEKDEVFELMRSQLPWAAEWLFKLDPVRAIGMAKPLEIEMRRDSYQRTYMLELEALGVGRDGEAEKAGYERLMGPCAGRTWQGGSRCLASLGIGLRERAVSWRTLVAGDARWGQAGPREAPAASPPCC